MEDENSTDNSQIMAYVIDFLEHLKSVEKHREKFMTFYPHWEGLRKSTIQALEELLERLKTEEKIADVGKAAGTASGIVGFVGGVVRFCSKRTISPIWTAITVSGHALKSGFQMAKAAAISRARKKVAKLLERDLQETKAFLRLGLTYDGVVKETEDTIEKIRQVSWTYSQELLEKETSSVASVFTLGGNGNPLTHIEVARSATRIIDEVCKIDIGNVFSIVQKFLEHNPELKRSFHSALQTVPNLISLNRLMDVEFVGGVAAGAVFAVGLSSLRQDFRDFAGCIYRLIDGTSDSQDDISRALKMLEEQHRLLQDVYTQLSGTDRSRHACLNKNG